MMANPSIAACDSACQAIAETSAAILESLALWAP